MTSKEFEGRSAAEAAIKACEELGVTRSALKYEVVSETGEDLTDRRVVITVEVDDVAAKRGSAFEDEPYNRSDRTDDRPPRSDRERSSRPRRDGPARPRGRGGRRDRPGDRDEGRSRRGRPPRSGGRGGRRDDSDGNIETLLNLEAIPEVLPEERPKVEGEMSARGEAAREVLLELVGLAGLDVEPRLVEDGEEIHFDLSGEDAARVIGKKGEALLALQFLANRIIARKVEGDQHVVLDAANYRSRRRDALAELAKRLATRALDEGKIVRLSPMSAHDRRIFHITLQEDEAVTTRSEGEGLYRPLLIIPSGE